MTIFNANLDAAIRGGGGVTISSGLSFLALLPTSIDPAVGTNGYNVPPVGVVMTARAATPTPSSLAYVAQRTGTLTQLSVRHRVAGGAATVITYTIWKNNVAVAASNTAVAANSATGVTTTFAGGAVAVGDRFEVVAVAAALISDGNMPKDVVAVISF